MPLVPPLAVLAVVAVLLAVRRVRGVTLPAWAVALAGGLAVVATGGVSPADAAGAIDWGVLATLAALFVVGAGLGRSRLADEALARLDRLPLSTPVLGGLLAGVAVLSALVTNDAVAVVGAPFLVRAAERRNLPPEPLLIMLMTGVTTGAVRARSGARRTSSSRRALSSHHRSRNSSSTSDRRRSPPSRPCSSSSGSRTRGSSAPRLPPPPPCCRR
jgi:hypothetical protein